MAEHSLRVFIGSSGEARHYAQALQAQLEESDLDVEPVVWTAGFALGQTNIENLVQNAEQADYAILIVTPDDLSTRRGESLAAPRDNVVFEIGLFIGRLGRDRTAIVCHRDAEKALPTDLLGVKVAPFGSRTSSQTRDFEAIGVVIPRLLGFLLSPRSTPALWPRWSGVGVPGRHLELFRCVDGVVEHRWFDWDEEIKHHHWWGWRPFPVPPPEAPIDVAACARPDGSRLNLFVLSASGRVAHLEWTATDRWSDHWAVFRGQVEGPITAASHRDDHAEVYAHRPGDRATVSQWLGALGDHYSWHGWDHLWPGPH